MYMKLTLELVGATLAIAWLIDYFQFRHERKLARREKRAGASRKWWNDREDGPEGDH